MKKTYIAPNISITDVRVTESILILSNVDPNDTISGSQFVRQNNEWNIWGEEDEDWEDDY